MKDFRHLKNFKQKVLPFLPLVLLVLSVALLGVSGGYAAGRHRVGNLEQAEAHAVLPIGDAKNYIAAGAASAADTQPPREPLFFVGIYGDAIAVFHNDPSRSLKELTGRVASSLPESEIRRLDEGIAIYSEEELLRVLQDYDS